MADLQYCLLFLHLVCVTVMRDHFSFMTTFSITILWSHTFHHFVINLIRALIYDL